MNLDERASTVPPLADGAQPTHYHLRLYTAGQSAKSMAAISNLRRVCNTHLDRNYEIEIIDLIEHPKRAVDDQILAIPTLIRCLPLPPKRIVGDLSLTEKVLDGLSISPKTGNT